MPVRIAVTGASGFVGRHVLKALLASDAAIVAATRTPAKLADLPDRIDVVELDIGAPQPQAFEVLSRPDVVLHLAWDGLPNYRSLHHFERELPRHYQFLKGLVEGGLPALVVTGTCFEYGMQSGPLSEETVCQPANPYALAKHTLHRQLDFLQRERAFNLTWARLFYTFGEGQAESSLWPQLRAALARGDREFNMSGGEQLRDFLPVSVVASHLAELTLKGLDAGAINICSGRPQSVRNLVEGWVADAGKTIALNLGYYPYPDYEPMAFWGDRTKLDLSIKRNILTAAIMKVAYKDE